MAVTFDAVGPSAAGASATANTALSWSHTCTGAGLCLFVGVAVGENPDTGFTTAATYNGVAMTSLGVVHSGSTNHGYVQMWYLPGPATGANTVAVAVTGGTADTLAGGSVSFTGVSQVAPVGTPVTGADAGAGAATGSVSVTGTTAGNMVVGTVATGSGGEAATGAGTLRWSRDISTLTTAGNAAQSTAPGGGTVALSFSFTNDSFGLIAVEVLAGDGPAQPSKVSDRGTVADATAATTSTLTLTSPTTIAVGNYLVARVAVDNSGTNGAAPGCTVTDPRSNTWTVLGPALADPGVAAAGATAYLCYAKVGTAYQAADALTFNWGGVSTTAKAVVVEEWSNIHRVTPVAVAAATNDSGAAASTTAVTVSRTATTPNQLVYTCLATEGVAADTVGADADTTNGSWVALTTTASANATATNNQRVSGQYKVVTDAGAQSWDSTITSRDWAAIAVVFAVDEPPPPRVFVRPGLAATQGGSW